jgi:uncharacterized lipoprotein
MKRFHSLVLGFIFLAFISGCAAIKEYPKYDQVLTYDKPFDFTFLRTLEALNTVAGWTLEETDKNKGVIVLRNVEYGSLFDRDKWLVRFNVVSLGRKKTSVSIDPSYQRNSMGGELLERIDQIMKMSASLKGEERAVALS